MSVGENVSSMPFSLDQRIAKAAELAQPIFAAHDWKWARDSEPHVPTVGEIALTIRRMYEDVASGDRVSLATGRLYVGRDEDDGSIGVEIELCELRDPEVCESDEACTCQEPLEDGDA